MVRDHLSIRPKVGRCWVSAVIWLGAIIDFTSALLMKEPVHEEVCHDSDYWALKDEWQPPSQIKRSLFSMDDDYGSRLWLGFDLPEGEMTSDLAKDLAKPAGKPKRPSHRNFLATDRVFAERLLVLGPMDSGTHLMRAAIEKNWPDMSDVYQQMSHYIPNTHVWKHSVDDEDIYKKLQLTANLTDLTRTALVIMLRSPLSNVVAWKESTYAEISHCVCRPWVDMSSPCKAFGYHEYAGTMEIFNHYMRTYARLRDSGRFSSVTIVTYEDMVSEPHRILEELGQTLGWATPSVIQIPELARGKRGIGRVYARARINERRHLKYIQPVLETLCSRLSRSAFEGFVESRNPGNESTQISYVHDCAEYQMAP